MLKLGDTVGVWVIEETLGQGLGRVFRCHNQEDPHLVAAIKPLDGTQAGWDLLRDRLLRDAKALLELEHPNLAKVRGLRLAGPFPCIEMAWVEGERLSERLPGAPQDPKQVFEWAAQLAGALVALHRVGLRHRDIKPDNLILTASGRLMLVDLGLPPVSDPPDDDDLPWVPPEWIGVPNGGDSALWDLYSVGVVLYELLTGTGAFVDLLSLGAAEVGAAKIAAGPLDPGPTVPVALRRLVRDLTWPEPRRRLPSATALMERLLRPDLSLLDPKLTLDDVPAVPISTVPSLSGELEDDPPTPILMGTAPPAPRPTPPRHLPPAPKSQQHLMWAALGVVAVLVPLLARCSGE